MTTNNIILNNEINIDLENISISDLVLLEIYDLLELFGLEIELEKNYVDYKIQMAMLGKLISMIREKDIETSEEIINFLDEHNSPEELYQKINFLLSEFTALNPELLRSIAYDIPELLDLAEVNISDELIIQRVLQVSDRLENSYNQLNLR